MPIEAARLRVVVGADTSQAEQGLQRFSNRLQGIAQRAGRAGSIMSAGITAPLVGLGAIALKSGIDFESAFAGVIKTVDATDEQLATLRTGIREMSRDIPVAATELAGIAESAGQLGIETENILSFTRTMADLGVATDLTGEQAATGMARLANITQMPQDQFDRLGSTIVALGNNLATTESEILTMGLRLSGAGAQVGLTEAQILSFAGALSSVGISAEAGGTAFSRVMVDMATSAATGDRRLSQFARVAGMSAGEFAEVWEEDAAGALIAFIEGLGTMSEAGEDVFTVLEDLELGEIRVRDALLRAAGAGDLFRRSMEIGNRAWEENNALTKEAEQRYTTSESRLIGIKEELVDLGRTLFDQVAPGFNELLQNVDDFIHGLGDLFAGLQETNPGLLNAALAFVGIAAAAGPVLLALSGIATALAAIGPVGLTVAGGVAALGAAWTANFLGMQTAVDSLLGTIGSLADSVQITWTPNFKKITLGELIDFTLFTNPLQTVAQISIGKLITGKLDMRKRFTSVSLEFGEAFKITSMFEFDDHFISAELDIDEAFTISGEIDFENHWASGFIDIGEAFTISGEIDFGEFKKSAEINIGEAFTLTSQINFGDHWTSGVVSIEDAFTLTGFINFEDRIGITTLFVGEDFSLSGLLDLDSHVGQITLSLTDDFTITGLIDLGPHIDKAVLTVGEIFSFTGTVTPEGAITIAIGQNEFSFDVAAVVTEIQTGADSVRTALKDAYAAGGWAGVVTTVTTQTGIFLNNLLSGIQLAFGFAGIAASSQFAEVDTSALAGNVTTWATNVKDAITSRIIAAFSQETVGVHAVTGMATTSGGVFSPIVSWVNARKQAITDAITSVFSADAEGGLGIDLSAFTEGLGRISTGITDFFASEEWTTALTNIQTHMAPMASKIGDFFASSEWTDALISTGLGMVQWRNSLLEGITGAIETFDWAAAATSFSGFVSDLVSNITGALTSETALGAMEDAGTVFGDLAGAIVGGLTDIFSNPDFGRNLGEATGEAAGAFVQMAMSMVTGLASEMSKINFVDFHESVGTFAKNFVSGVASGLAGQDWSPIAKALLDGIAGAVASVVLAPLELQTRDAEQLMREQGLDGTGPSVGSVLQAMRERAPDSGIGRLLDSLGGSDRPVPVDLEAINLMVPESTLRDPIPVTAEVGKVEQAPNTILGLDVSSVGRGLGTVLSTAIQASLRVGGAGTVGGAPLLSGFTAPVDLTPERTLQEIYGGVPGEPRVEVIASVSDVTQEAMGPLPEVEVKGKIVDAFAELQAGGMQGLADALGGTGGAGSELAAAADTLNSFSFTWPPLPEWTWPTLPQWVWPDYPQWVWPTIERPSWLSELQFPRPSWIGEILSWSPVVRVQQDTGGGGASAVPSIPVEVPPFSGNALGTPFFRGGLTMVGERGRELVSLPRGSRIFNDSDTEAILASAGGPQVVVNATVRNDLDIELLARRVQELVRQRR